MDFYEAAQYRFLEAVERRDCLSGKVFATVYRGKQKVELASATFDSNLGQVLEPVRTEKGYVIVLVLSFKPARLDDQTVTEIKKILFEKWLAELRHRARIEWNWGNVNHTALSE
jgi:hypothetical protein